MRKIIFIFFIFAVSYLTAQEKPQPPIGVELLFGNNRLNAALSLNKPVWGKWRFNNITTAAAYYDVADGKTELVMVNSLIYQFHPNFGASGGLQYHFLKGLVPNVAFHTSYADRTWLLVFTPYLNLLPERHSETIAIVQYKPALSENLRLFTQVQALYNHNLNANAHDRSFYYFRLGLTVKKITFGAGANLDYYGPDRIFKDNYGGFVKVDI